MAQPEDILSSDLAKGAMVGIGLAVLVPVAATALAPVLRPVARSALKAGLIALEKGREAAAELGEMVEDVMAEVQEELRTARETEEMQPAEAGAAAETVDPGETSADQTAAAPGA